MGLLAWSPVNLCPPENEDVPCPAPAGAVLPWHVGETALDLPEARADAGAATAASQVFVIGGTAGQDATDSVFVAPVSANSLFTWTTGPTLPAARTDASVVVYSGTIYVIGGRGPDGRPTDTVYSMTPPLSGALPDWTEVADLKLPGPLAGAAVAATGDGIVLVGGANADGPQTAVWKARFVTDKLTKWAQQPGLLVRAQRRRRRGGRGRLRVAHGRLQRPGTGEDGPARAHRRARPGHW